MVLTTRIKLRSDSISRQVKLWLVFCCCSASPVIRGIQSGTESDMDLFRQHLYMLSRFRKAQRILSWTNGATIYANFQNQMEDTSEWDAVSHPFAQSVQGFGEAVDAHLLLLFPADAWEMHRNFVMNRKKGIKESPSEFMSRISFHDMVLGLLPGHPAGNVGAPDQQLIEHNKKQMLCNGVPEEHREDFRKAGMSLTAEGLNDLIKCMDDLHSMDHTAQKASHSSTNGNSSHIRPGGRVPSRGNYSEGPSARPGRGRPHGNGSYNRPCCRPCHSQCNGCGGGNYQGQGQSAPQGNRGGAMPPRRLEFNGNGGRSAPAGRHGGYRTQSNNYQPAGRGTESHCNARQTRVRRDGHHANRERRAGRTQGSYGRRQGPGGSYARRTQGGNRSSHCNDPGEAHHNNEGEEEAVEDYDQVEEHDYDPNDDGCYGEEVEEELDEACDEFDEGYDEPEGGHFAENCGDGFVGKAEIEDPDGLLEADPIPEELDATANLEEGCHNDDGSDSSPPSATRNQSTAASSVSSRYSTEHDSEGDPIPGLTDTSRERHGKDQHFNDDDSEADDASKASDTSSKDSGLKITTANVTRDKAPQVTWQRNKIHNVAFPEDLSPHAVGQAYEVGGSAGRCMFRTLFDSGSTSDMIKKSALPRGAKLIPLPRGEGVQTTGGPTQVAHCVVLDTIAFPEFSPARHLKERKMMVFDSPAVRCDVIVGRKTLAEMGMSLDFKSNKMRW